MKKDLERINKKKKYLCHFLNMKKNYQFERNQKKKEFYQLRMPM